MYRTALITAAAFFSVHAISFEGRTEPFVSFEARIEIEKDSYIDKSQAAANFGSEAELYVHGYTTDLYKQALFQFDLSVLKRIPMKAELMIYQENYACGGVLSAYALLAEWDESQVTWNERLAGTAWSTPGLQAGVDYQAEGCGEAEGAPGAWLALDITGLAADWMSGSPNYGLVVRPKEDFVQYCFRSSDYADPEYHPYLRLTYPAQYDVVLGVFPQHLISWALKADYLFIGPGGFRLHSDENLDYIESAHDLVLQPAAGAKIVPATMMEFPDDLGDKIRFYSHSYSIGLSPFDLDITSDRNIKFHSDTSPDLFVILGDAGDAQSKRDLQAGRDVISSGVFKFAEDAAGDKYLLYGTLYRMAISPYTFDFYSDDYFAWHSDTNGNAMTLDANNGILDIGAKFSAGGLQGVSGTIQSGSTIVVTGGIITDFY